MKKKLENLNLNELNQVICKCRLCPRLVHFRETVPKKEKYQLEKYWRKPLAGFGDRKGWLLILGLAPAPHGGNRTGRIFTGDASAQFLMKALCHEGFANQPFSEKINDGLKLFDCYITAAVKCVPPHNLPLAIEVDNCSRYLTQELRILTKITTILALGRLAFEAYVNYVRTHGENIKKISFEHGKKYPFKGFPTLYASYHPSPQNTNTGVLTEKMFYRLLKELKKDKNK